MRRPLAATSVLAVWLAGMALAASGCDRSPFDEEPSVPPPPGPPPVTGGGGGGREPSRASGSHLPDSDASIALSDRSDPLAPAGDLRAEADAFTSLDTCVGEHSGFDPLLGDAVRALGYDTIIRDACRVLQALKLKDSSPCSAITASGLQQRCLSLVAMAAEDPDHCPWIASTERALGRDPLCLAVATHDVRFCAATTTAKRAMCEALATGDAKRCQKVGGDERRQCERESDRDRSLVVVPEHDVHDTTAPKARLEVKGAEGTANPPQGDVDLAEQIAPGAVLAANPGGGTRIDVARDREGSLHLPSRAPRTRVVASLIVDQGPPTVERFEVDAPKLPPIVCPSAHCEVHATIGKVSDLKRSAPLTIVIDAKAQTTSGTYAVHAQIDTFVRDLVGRSSMYSPR